MNDKTAQGEPVIKKSEEEWRRELSPEQYRVLREKGTERAFTGEYAHSKDDGIYVCAGCGQPLFSSEDKFESGTGWPSYFQPFDPGAVETKDDMSHFMRRTEALCSKCGGHLGHVFDDGPRPTGKRYCINSASLKLQPGKDHGGFQDANHDANHDDNRGDSRTAMSSEITAH